MTKAPFSVEWLSQSSRKPSHLGQGDSEAFIGEGGRGPHILAKDLLFSWPPDTLGSEGPSTSSRPPELPAATVGGLKLPKGPPVSQESRSLGEEASPEVSSGSSGLPEGPSPEPHGRGARRLRTAFTTKQISTLESSFKRHHYLGAAERRKLAGKMQLSEVQIKTWFQNRRMKLKRQLQDLRPPDPPPGFPLHLYSPLLLRSAPVPPPGLPYVYPSSPQLRVPRLVQEPFVGGLALLPHLPPLPLPPSSCKAAPPAIPSVLACLLSGCPDQASFLRAL
ncbi:homeobox protein VENTX [Trichosurus vulpecula]|uniref:homeobox protein VENTX n=1 Tax=Trichosurus vulpecula TaxID=9337 RepID=UPI00186AC9FE|nr:homeobox protein VENTX [Trichosurus vulpecula]